MRSAPSTWVGNARTCAGTLSRRSRLRTVLWIPNSTVEDGGADHWPAARAFRPSCSSFKSSAIATSASIGRFSTAMTRVESSASSKDRQPWQTTPTGIMAAYIVRTETPRAGQVALQQCPIRRKSPFLYAFPDPRRSCASRERRNRCPSDDPAT